MSIKKERKYNINYNYANGKDALNFEIILQRLFKKFLVNYDSKK